MVTTSILPVGDVNQNIFLWPKTKMRNRSTIWSSLGWNLRRGGWGGRLFFFLHSIIMWVSQMIRESRPCLITSATHCNANNQSHPCNPLAALIAGVAVTYSSIHFYTIWQKHVTFSLSLVTYISIVPPSFTNIGLVWILTFSLQMF